MRRSAKMSAAVNLEEAAEADDKLPVKVGDTVVVTTAQGLLEDAKVLGVVDVGCFARTADGEVAGYTWDLVALTGRPDLLRAGMQVRVLVDNDQHEPGKVAEATEQGCFVKLDNGPMVAATWCEVELCVADWLKHRQQAGKADADLKPATAGA